MDLGQIKLLYQKSFYGQKGACCIHRAKDLVLAYFLQPNKNTANLLPSVQLQ